MAKRYETKRIIVARFSVRNINDDYRDDVRFWSKACGIKGMMNLSTRRRTMAQRPKI